MISLSPPPNASASLTPTQRGRRHAHPLVLLRGRPAFVRPFSAAPSSSSSSPAAVSAPPTAEPPRAVVIGAGLAGLAAAARLHASGVPVVVLEASDGVGGRVRTDAVEGFLLDRGFQILITAYPEARRVLDYAALDLRRFYSGALVYAGGGRFHRVADPLRHPLEGISGLLNPVGTVADKVRVGLARIRAAARADAEILAAEEVPIIDRLRAEGFTDSIVEQFFRPFFGGVFFDRGLQTTSRLFDFVFKCLALGDNALPAGGIGAIPEQLAARLPPGTVRLGSRAVAVEPETSGGPPTVRLEGGGLVRGELGVVVAVEGPEAERLLPWAEPVVAWKEGAGKRPPRSTTCIYYSAERAPVREPILLLNGSGEGRVNNMFFATSVAPSYGPAGKALVSVSLIGEAEEGEGEVLAREVAGELGGWFGKGEVAGWRHLRTYRIGFAQPDQSPPTELAGREPRAGGGVYLCGDHWRSATFDGALASGRAAAEALVRDRAPARELLQAV